MRASDLSLLARKIAVGIVITMVPLAIVAGSLWLTQHTLSRSAARDGSTGVFNAN
jgi:hypothetical protein